MADTKITQLQPPQVGYPVVPATDVLPIVVIADPGMATSGSTRKVTVNQILGAGGTATLASATITGDLTVDTSTLKVDSTNNRVGIGTATPAAPLHIQAPGTDSAAIRLAAAGGRTYDINSTAAGYGSANNLIIYDITGSAERWRLDATGNHFWNNVGGVAGTAMTLNSTGLGVGDAPAANSRLTIGSTNATGFQYALRTTGITTGRSQIYLNNTSGDLIAGIEGSSGGSSITGSAAYSAFIGTFTNNPFYLVANSAIRATIDSSGNVGVGVTPSAWYTTGGYRALQIGNASLYGRNSTNSEAYLSANAFENASASPTYITSSFASRYTQDNGVHKWLTAPSGTAGNTITFTQAMTLNAAGSLVLGAAAVATTATDGFLYIPGCAGTPTGTPTAQTGRVPLVVDTTNNKLYFYSGGSWVAAN